ncbi:hypothetical protein PBCV1_a675L [Paramecium bursaria Chlorella virus 1]|uniref:Uncharacterized protein n=1 Tax=Paramecium bursaria Chlorella virus 1 TaxID=10506 RepID=O41157_PBCV1|nr:hypothetical protein PBCV1_a675L [Paramecium bursaria Chlorella virus 1]AAC97050.1 hypothetical protein [Paramecium bursaria Chlorella virus 1]
MDPIPDRTRHVNSSWCTQRKNKPCTFFCNSLFESLVIELHALCIQFFLFGCPPRLIIFRDGVQRILAIFMILESCLMRWWSFHHRCVPLGKFLEVEAPMAKNLSCDTARRLQFKSHERSLKD